MVPIYHTRSCLHPFKANYLISNFFRIRVRFNGDSRQGIEAGSDATTAAFPIRVLDLVEDTKKSNGKYVEALVKINNHQYNNTTGV